MQSEGDSQSGSTGRRPRRSGGFLLDSMFSNHSSTDDKGKKDKHGKRKAQDSAPLQVDKRRSNPPKLSGESSHGASPLSRAMSPPQRESQEQDRQEQNGKTHSRDSSLDPAQLVQMALNLSQSRRRHASNTLQLPLPAGPNQTRVRTSGAYGRDTVRKRSEASRWDSHLADEAFSDTLSNREASRTAEPQKGDWSEEPGSMLQNCSPATLARVEKAQKYFELANEHRRLLRHLPPLKPDNSAPGNYVVSSKNSPGTAFPQITRTLSYTNSKHELGRAYDPLQAIRNRRQRNRERRPLTCPTDQWQDVEVVKSFVDEVEAAAKGSQYRKVEDKVKLPVRTEDAAEDTQHTEDRSNKHRRTGMVGTLNTRPDNEWSIDPTELLADTYWVEQDENKRVIENGRGTKVFPQKGRQSLDHPRRSKDLVIEERPSLDSRWSGRSGRSERNQSVGSEDDRDHEERHPRRRHLLPAALKSGSKLKMVSRSRSGSRSSAASNDRDGRNHFQHRLSEDCDNVRALDRQMQKMIAEEEEKQHESSPDITSPDHWDSKHTQFPNARAQKGSKETKRLSLILPSGDSVGASHSNKRSKSVDGVIGRQGLSNSNPRESMEGYETADPESPKVQTFEPPVGMDLSPPKKPGSSHNKSKIPKFGLFKSSSKDHQNIDRTDFAQVDSKHREPSGSTAEPVRKSVESYRPLGPWRTKTESNVHEKLNRSDTESTTNTKDSLTKESSGMGRWFRGRRIGDFMRGDHSRMHSRDTKGKEERSRNVSYETDPEDNRSVLSSLERTNTDLSSNSDELSPRCSKDLHRKKPQYHTSNLPSFSSPRKQSETPSCSNTDPIGRQQAAQRLVGRPSRFDQLPKINLPDGGTTGPKSDTLLDHRRKSYGFLETVTSPGNRDEDHAAADSDQSPSAGPRSDASALAPSRSSRGRQWSISDNKPSNTNQTEHSQTTHVTSRDIIRVRALLLSSGIKAHELESQAHQAPPQPSPFFQNALKTSSTPAPSTSIPRIDETLYAARLLSVTLSTRLTAYERALKSFRTSSIPALTSQQDELRGKVSDNLTARVHETSDGADAFTVELTTQQTLRVKQVDDAVDAMLRRRRRQWRVLKKFGFKLLEWGVLGVMWGIWGVVVLVNLVRGLLAGVGRVVRWLVVF